MDVDPDSNDDYLAYERYYFVRNMQPHFDIDAALFSVLELSQVSGISRSAIDMYLHRGVLTPARRARTSNPTRRTKGPGGKTNQGRPMFSVANIFKARLIRELGTALGLGPSESSLAADAAENAKISNRELKDAKITEITSGETWMWVLAKSVEKNQPLNIYAYAARSKDKWKFDIHVGEKGLQPDFGRSAPYIYVLVSEIFIAVYNECKIIAGVTVKETKGENA